MNLDNTLTFLSDTRYQLSQWGVGSVTLILLGIFALACLFVSMREVLSWYLRMQELRDQVRELKHEIIELKHALRDVDFARTQSNEPLAKTEASNAESKQLKFRLDH